MTAFHQPLKTNQKKISDLIDHSYMPSAMKARASQLVESRIRAMQIVEANDQ